MSKLLRDVQAFARRVQMSEIDLFILVEGRNHDRPFYERVLAASPASSGKRVSVRLAEELTLNGSNGGGKTHALQLHDHLSDQGQLTQENAQGTRWIAFMLDKDLDDYNGTARMSPHVIYSENADIEAEILVNGDWKRALASSHGLSQKEIARIEDRVPDPVTTLASLWKEWVALRLAAGSCGYAGVAQFGALSRINNGTYGVLDEQARAAIEKNIVSQIGGDEWAKILEIATRKVGDAIDLGNAGTLLKGKWMANFFLHLVRLHLAQDFVKSNVQADTVVGVSLETLQYDHSWMDHYNGRIGALLAA